MSALRRFYPILFALFPGLSMLAANKGEVEPTDAWRVLAVSAALAAIAPVSVLLPFVQVNAASGMFPSQLALRGRPDGGSSLVTSPNTYSPVPGSTLWPTSPWPVGASRRPGSSARGTGW